MLSKEQKLRRNAVEFLPIEDRIPRYTPQYRDLYAKRKETIERVFADAQEKHAIRYTQ